VEIFDWNQIEQAKSLGSARIDLASLEPFQATERSLTLHSTKHGDKGSVRIRMVFRPEILVKSRKNTHATFQSAGKTMTQIGILPVTAGKGVLQGVTGVFRKEKDFAKEANGNDVQAVPDVATGQASHPVGQPDSVGGMGSATFPSLTPPSGSPGEGSKTVPGTLRVTVIDAKDLTQHDVKPYVLMRVGDKEVKTKAGKTETPEWHVAIPDSAPGETDVDAIRNESFNFSAGSLTQKIFLWVYDHKTLAKDKVLSEGEVDVCDVPPFAKVVLL
jgi:Ca2+-dependent lipid-binding protein